MAACRGLIFVVRARRACTVLVICRAMLLCYAASTRVPCHDAATSDKSCALWLLMLRKASAGSGGLHASFALLEQPPVCLRVLSLLFTAKLL